MQRIILRQLKESVHKLQGNRPAEIEKYTRDYQKELRNYQKISSKSELLKAARQAHIIFGADFHPFAQSQRTHLRILRELIKGSRPLVLALEAIDSKFQKHVDAYLKGKYDDKTFLKKINYTRSWGFPWENYKILFDFAKTYNLPIYGINQSALDRKNKNLQRREEHSARQIGKLRGRFPKAIIYVIYGDLHLASRHLPRLTRKYLRPNYDTRFLTVFQDSENLYWRLAKRRLEERVDVLKLRSDAFCVVNSPPWIKWQAYLNFLEHELDGSDRDPSLDMSEQIAHFTKLLKRLWNIPQSLEDFNAYVKGEMPFAYQGAKRLPKGEFTRVMSLVRGERSFFIPHPPIFYFSSFDLNHIVSLVAQYIHAQMRKETRMHLQFPKDLTPLIWIESVGFFGSKLLNSRRKFSHLQHLPKDHKITLIALEQKLHEQMALKTGFTLRPIKRDEFCKSKDYYNAAKVMGSVLGNRLYVAFQKKHLNEETLRDWLKTPVGGTSHFFKFYISVLKQMKKVKAEEKNFRERL